MDENSTPTGGPEDHPASAPGPHQVPHEGPHQPQQQYAHPQYSVPPQSGPRVSWSQVQDTSRLSRPHDRMFTGVAAGLARHLDVDPLLVRIGFGVLAFFGGAGILLYGALWLLMPEDGQERAVVQLDPRNRRFAVIGALVLTALIALGNSWNFSWVPWPLAIVGLIAWALWSKREESTPSGQGPSTASPASAPQTPGASPYASGSGGWTSPAPATDTSPQAHTTAAAPAQTSAAPAASSSDAGAPPAPWTLPVPPPAPAWTPQPQIPPTHQFHGPTATQVVPRTARPADPRAKGPALFWITAALIALGIGILGMVEVAGVTVVDSAYPALALTITALMLLVGAFWGRARGLVALGIVCGLVTFANTSNEHWDEDAPTLAPVVAADVPDQHDFRVGHMILDLSDVRDVEALDGRSVDLVGGVGAIDVIVPEGIALRVRAEVGGPGGTFILGQRQGGIAIEHQVNDTSGDSVALMTLDLELGVGKITVKRSGPPPPADPSVSPDPSSEPAPEAPSIDIDPEAGDQR